MAWKCLKILLVHDTIRYERNRESDIDEIIDKIDIELDDSSDNQDNFRKEFEMEIENNNDALGI